MGNVTLPLTRPEMPAQPGVSLAGKIASLKWGQVCEYKDYDVGFSRGQYYVNWQYGCYGIKQKQRRFDTIQGLEAFLREQGVAPELFAIQWSSDLFNGM